MSEIHQFLKQFFTEKQINKFEKQILHFKYYYLFNPFNSIKSKKLY
jgi:hypothetical protein